MLTSAERHSAVEIAWRAVREPLRTGRRWVPDPATLCGSLAEPGACFVTLRTNGRLLGCIGSLAPRRPLGVDVAANAAAAAFDDPRLPPVTEDDLTSLDVHVSVLGPLTPLPVEGARELRAALQPGVDGVVVESEGRRATFLPSVWEQVRDTGAFLDALWRKAGLPPGSWPPTITVQTYRVQEFS